MVRKQETFHILEAYDDAVSGPPVEPRWYYRIAESIHMTFILIAEVCGALTAGTTQRITEAADAVSRKFWNVLMEAPSKGKPSVAHRSRAA